MDFYKNNRDAGVQDIYDFVVENMQGENPTFSFDLGGVEIKGSSSKIRGEMSFGWNDRVAVGGELLGEMDRKGGSISLTSNNGRVINPKYWKSNWTGGTAAQIKTYNVSKVIKQGTIAITVVLGAMDVGKRVANNFQDYNRTDIQMCVKRQWLLLKQVQISLLECILVLL